MPKYKIIFSILILSLLLVACNDKKDTKEETNKESVIESVDESKEETKPETVKETKEETEKETVKETETEEETNSESKEESKDDKIVKLREDEKSDDENVGIIETIDTEKSDQDHFDNEMTEEMQKALKKYAVTLVSVGGNTIDLFPKEDLQAIASYEDSESLGWVVRYGKNKIGLAQSYHQSTTGVFVMFDGRGILETKEDLIKNDTPEEFKQRAQEIIKKQISGDAKVKYAY